MQKTLLLLEPVKYFSLTKEWTKINEYIRFKFYDAGHILGSAITLIEIKEKGKIKVLAYTGDLGQKGAPILKDNGKHLWGQNS